MNTRHALISASFAAAALVGAAPAQAITTFFNDWESVDFGSAAGFTVLPAYEGWTTTAGSGIEVQFNNVAGLPLSGENLVELDSFNNSEMSRPIDAGNYTLTFYYSARPGRASATNGIDVRLNGATIFSVTGDGGNQTDWKLQTVNFSLLAPGTLSFAAIGTSDGLGGYLENLKLGAAVPEPASWALMVGGFALAGAALRRRSKLVPASA